MTDIKVYKRGVLKGRLKKESFEEAITQHKTDNISAIMGGVYFVGKLKEIIVSAMTNSNTQALTKDMFEKSVELFLKKTILDLEAQIRKGVSNGRQ